MNFVWTYSDMLDTFFTIKKRKQIYRYNSKNQFRDIALWASAHSVVYVNFIKAHRRKW